jgi:hypothetical protein
MSFSASTHPGHDGLSAPLRALKDAVTKSLDKDSLSREDVVFLSDLQDVHDGFEHEQWESQLEILASRYGLES